MDELRYSRNLAVDGFTPEMQSLINSSRVLVVGAGGLGSALLSYITAAGVGSVGVVEYDTVNITNLQRQILYTEKDLGCNKGAVAVARLSELNSQTKLTHYNTKFTISNGEEIAANYDMIVDCSDNYDARVAMDSVSRRLGIPFIYGSAEQLSGQISTFNYKGAGGYSTLFNEPESEEKTTIGVLSPVPGVIGSLQALEVIKIATNSDENLCGKLLIFDLNSYNITLFKV